MELVQIKIDEQVLQVSQESTIMEAAEASNIYIPHLCHHPDLPDIGTCGLCVVEIEGENGLKAACMTKVTDGMVIHTKSDEINRVRRLNMELILSNHVDDCTTCPKYSNCELQSLYQYLGVTVGRLKQTLNSVPVNEQNPLIIRDLNRCVSCSRCVRVCKDVRGVDVLDFERTESGRVQVDIRGHKLLTDTDCRFCGACIEVCPTGALRDKEGVFRTDIKRDMALVPCKAECPAQIDIPRYIRYVKENRFQDAIAVIREKVPFPASLGHICMAFCEAGCKRNGLNGALSIRELKKFAASQDEGLWRKRETIKPDTGKKVAIVGAGPAGLTAAYDLRKSGHEVTVFEQQPVAGGMLATGIPDYRLPREIVKQEIDEIIRTGVVIHTDTKIKSCKQLKEQGYDAILLALGTGVGIRLPISGNECPNVYVNIEFLQRAALGNPMPVGEKVVVLGGGNVAFDCAQVAKRLGATDITMACLESREAMTASEDEIKEGLEEGIKILNSRTFLAIEEEDGVATGVKCQSILSFGFDENHRLQIETVPDSEEILKADTVIFATGQRVEKLDDEEITFGKGNSVQTTDGVRVNKDYIYAAGDAVYGTKSVIQAIVSGHEAAKAIDIDLGGNGEFMDKLAPQDIAEAEIGICDNFACLERNIHCNDSSEACIEAERCLQCDLRTQIQKSRLWTSY